MAEARTFRASTSTYAILCSLTLVPTLLLIAISIRDGRSYVALMLAFLVFPVACVIGLNTLRLTLDDTGLTYRRLFAGTSHIEYSDIVGVHSTHNIITSLNPSLRGVRLIGVDLKLRGGGVLTILCKPFPRDAYEALLALKPSGLTTASSARRTP